MFDEQKPAETGEASVHTPVFHQIRSKYEFVMAAAKEAERLNDRYRTQGYRPILKVTMEAVDRVRRGACRIAYEEPQSPSDESPKETTYFFGG